MFEAIPESQSNLPEYLHAYAAEVDQLRRVGNIFWQRGWSLGTSSNYSVVVTNVFGSVTSSVMSLVVNPAPIGPGSLDFSFNPGLGITNESGGIASVSALVLQGDGKVVLGGSFTAVNGVARTNIARLNTNGTVDASFNAGAAAVSEVRCLALQPDGKILMGGLWSPAGSGSSGSIAAAQRRWKSGHRVQFQLGGQHDRVRIRHRGSVGWQNPNRGCLVECDQRGGAFWCHAAQRRRELRHRLQ